MQREPKLEFTLVLDVFAETLRSKLSYCARHQSRDRALVTPIRNQEIPVQNHLHAAFPQYLWAAFHRILMPPPHYP